MPQAGEGYTVEDNMGRRQPPSKPPRDAECWEVLLLPHVLRARGLFHAHAR